MVILTLTHSAIFVVTILLLVRANGLRKYTAEARRCGMRYVTSPIHFQSIPWLLSQEALRPFLELLPETWTEEWLPLSLFYRLWHHGYTPFARVGTDTFMIVSPSGNIVWTCDPSIISQVSSRRQGFLKPVEMLGMLNMYGPTLTGTEGEEYIQYRKIAAPSFNEVTHETVWTETMEQTKAFTKSLVARPGESVQDLASESAKMALHVLSKGLFGIHMQWEDEKSQATPPEGHKISYNHAIRDLFKHNATLFTTPSFILNNSTSKVPKAAGVAFQEFKKYMREIHEQTAKRLQNSPSRDGEGSLMENFVRAGMPELNPDRSVISSDAVMGNSYIFVLAGHETNANTLTHALTLLACRPDFQVVLQEYLDSQLPEDPASWVYGTHFSVLWDGPVGALMQETLRLYSPLPFIPKINREPQIITSSTGRRYTVAANTIIMMNVSATHRNPQYWPTSPNYGRTPAPLLDFQPERWLPSAKSQFKPPDGAYIPFGEGFRSCMGSRFAKVEFCAAIGKLLKEYSIELEDNSHEGLFAAEEALTSGMKLEMAMKMSISVPLKFVRRK